MKKLLALMLVLGMAAVANADVMLAIDGDTTVETIEVPTCSTVWIDVYSNTSDGYGWWVGIVDDQGYDCTGGEFTGQYVIYPAAGADATIDPGYLPNWWAGEAKSFSPENPVQPGVHYSLEYHCLGAFCEWCYVTLYAFDAVTVLDVIAVHQIPEPATMLLLGLGGLLLRRRK